VTGNSGNVTAHSGSSRKSVTFKRIPRSPSPGTTGHVQAESAVTIARNTHAAAQVLDQAIPGLEIRAFAVVRTMGLVPDVEEIRWPVVGEIRFEGGDAVRDP